MSKSTLRVTTAAGVENFDDAKIHETTHFLSVYQNDEMVKRFNYEDVIYSGWVEPKAPQETATKVGICLRCEGTGTVRSFRNVCAKGVCFKCHGTGKI